LSKKKVKKKKKVKEFKVQIIIKYKYIEIRKLFELCLEYSPI